MSDFLLYFPPLGFALHHYRRGKREPHKHVRLCNIIHTAKLCKYVWHVSNSAGEQFGSHLLSYTRATPDTQPRPLETLKKTKQQCLVMVDFVEKQQGLWRGTLEVPLWQASSLSGISRVPAKPAAEEGAQGCLDQPALGVPREGRVVLLLKVRWLYLRPRASGIPAN